MIYTIVHVIYDIKNCINHKNTITVSITISQIHSLRLRCDQYLLHTAQCFKLSQNKSNFPFLISKSSIIIISSISIYQISEKQFSRVFIGSRNSEYPHVATHSFATAAKMASHFEIFLEDEICAINEAVAQTNTKKATNFGLSVFTGR